MGEFFSGIFSGLFDWIGGILALGVFLGFLYVIGLTGSILRKGVALGIPKLIFLPLLGWSAFYFVLFYFLPLNMFLLSFLLLIAPILGYFGYFFGPDLD